MASMEEVYLKHLKILAQTDRLRRLSILTEDLMKPVEFAGESAEPLPVPAGPDGADWTAIDPHDLSQKFNQYHQN